MVVEPVLCPTCQGIDIVKHGLSAEGKPRYKCRNPDCQRCTFILNYSYQGHLPEVKQQIIEMALNSSGICDTARDSKRTLSNTLESISARKGASVTRTATNLQTQQPNSLSVG